MLGGSIAVGFAAGYLLPKLLEGRNGAGMSENDYEPVRGESLRAEPARERPSFLKASFFADLIGPELEKLKNYAVESLKGVVHEFIAKSVPGYEQGHYDPGHDQPQRPDYERKPFSQGHAGDEPMHS